tara:strand:+ start:403 stop:1527 length:1125 start_codon:yes stop_codon:yes gene_type:complete
MARRLEKEWAQMEEEWLEDPFWHVSERQTLEWVIHFTIRSQNTAYRNSRLQTRFVFPLTYPFKPPDVFFEPPIYHPYVSTEGKLCDCVLQLEWKGQAPRLGVKHCIARIYNLLISDGSNLDSEKVCFDVDVKNIRDQNYMLFDSIIQRSLGNDLPEDEKIVNNDFFWNFQIILQNKLDLIRTRLVTSLLGGGFEGLQTIIMRFMGIDPRSTFERKATYTTNYIFPKIDRPSINIRLTSSDGELTVQRWSSIELFQIDELDNSIELAQFNTADLQNVFDMYDPSSAVSLRMFRPTSRSAQSFVEPFQRLDASEALKIVKCADFLGIERLVAAGCLHLSHIIMRESRHMRERKTHRSNSSGGAHFKSYIHRGVDSV